MADGKKDILEFPLEDVEVPQAIALMMQAATACVEIEEGDEARGELFYKETNNDRLQLLCEKLEARVEDAIEATMPAPVTEDATDEVVVGEGDIFLMEDGKCLNYKGQLYRLACNEVVMNVSDGDEVYNTFCIKQWDHQSLEHEDTGGNVR